MKGFAISRVNQRIKEKGQDNAVAVPKEFILKSIVDIAVAIHRCGSCRAYGATSSMARFRLSERN